MIAAWIIGPVGRYVMIAAAFAAWTFYQRDLAADHARAECRAEQIQAVLDQTERDKRAAEKALAEARQRATQTEREMAALEQDRDQIIADLREAGATACFVPDDIRERLRRVR